MNEPLAASRLDRLLRFLGADPRNPQLLADALNAARDEGDAHKAAVVLAHVEKYGAPSPAVAAHAALLYLQLGQPAPAAAYGEEALAGGIDDEAVRINTAWAQFYTGNFARVAELLAPLDPAALSAPTLVLHARALHHLERPEDARPLLQRAIALEPANAEALGVLALLEQEDDLNESAQALAERALLHDPAQLEALLALGGLYTEREEWTDARAHWQAAVTHHPDCGRAWSGLAMVAFSLLDFDAAEQHLHVAVKHMPNHIGTWHLLAWIHILRNQPEQARAAFTQALAIDRSFGDTHGGFAVVDAMEGRDEEARINIRKALRLMPTGMAARYAELLLLQKAGDTRSAQALVEQTMDAPVRPGQPTRRSLVERRLQQLMAQRATDKSLH